ncbi:hypothetical protein B566_EDAN010936, partial [Ephemera danica]
MMSLLLPLVCLLALSVPGGDGTYMDLVVSDHNEFGYAPHNGGDGTNMGYIDLVVSDHNEFGYAPHNGQDSGRRCRHTGRDREIQFPFQSALLSRHDVSAAAARLSSRSQRA